MLLSVDFSALLCSVQLCVVLLSVNLSALLCSALRSAFVCKLLCSVQLCVVLLSVNFIALLCSVQLCVVLLSAGLGGCVQFFESADVNGADLQAAHDPAELLGIVPGVCLTP